MLLWLGHTSGVSLDGLVEQVSRALGEARSLFGAAPAARQWGSTAALSAGREGVARAVGAASQSWQGQGASGYLSGGKNGVAALDSVIDADAGSAAGFDASAGASRSGGTGMDTVINDTRARVAAVAPSTDTPAGKAQLVADLKTQLQRAKALLVVSERRNIELAAMIRAAAGGYRRPMAGPGMPAMGGTGAMPVGAPMMGAGGLGGLAIPNLAQLTGSATPVQTVTPHRTERADAGAALGRLTVNSTPLEVAAAIIHEAHRRGYSPGQTIAILSTGLQESGLNPPAVSPNRLWENIFQQDMSYPGRGNPNTAITGFFDRLDQKGGPTSPNIWKSIFWLQQRPGEPSADAALAHGRQAYLSEIQSQIGKATAMYEEIAGT